MNAPQRVLLVDDDADVRAVATMALQLLGGMVVFAASSAVEAVGLLARSQPDIILLDVMMPDADGIVTYGMLRAAGTEAPIVFMSACVRTEDRARLIAIGGAGVIAKPFDPRTLSADLHALWSVPRD